MDQMPKMSLLFLLLCIFMSIKNQTTHNTPNPFNTRTTTRQHPSSSSFLSSFPTHLVSLSEKHYEEELVIGTQDSSRWLQYDFYRKSCPQAEQIIRDTVHRLRHSRPNLVPALVRLSFHDCFVHGCDASLLLDANEGGIGSEKESPPNESLKGFDVIDMIKSKLEAECPGVVSCSDILVVAARDSLVLAGGPFYPITTGRRDGSNTFYELALREIPTPRDSLPRTLASFASKGFDERETVSLLGAHSIGVIHCKFFHDRLYNFSGTNGPDPSLDIGFLNLLKSRCKDTRASPSSKSILNPLSLHSIRESPSPSNEGGSPSSSIEDSGIALDNEEPKSEFGTLYYSSLLQGKGILYADQQLMAGERTGMWVKAYASDASLFHRDFTRAMVKLSNLRALTAPLGQIRLNCSSVA